MRWKAGLAALPDRSGFSSPLGHTVEEALCHIPEGPFGAPTWATLDPAQGREQSSIQLNNTDAAENTLSNTCQSATIPDSFNIAFARQHIGDNHNKEPPIVMAMASQLNSKNGLPARTITVNSQEELPATLRAIGIQYPQPTLVLIGGAGGISEARFEKLYPLFQESLAPVVESGGALIIDGGTNSGIMRLIGKAHQRLHASFPLVGVVPIGVMTLLGNESPRRVLLEPHHTHFVLVPGSEWGDESQWIAQIATLVAGDRPSVTILIEGGEIAWEDVLNSVSARRQVIVIRGSGGTADQLASVMRGGDTDPRALDLITSGLLREIDAISQPERLAAELVRILFDGDTPCQDQDPTKIG